MIHILFIHDKYLYLTIKLIFRLCLSEKIKDCHRKKYPQSKKIKTK